MTLQKQLLTYVKRCNGNATIVQFVQDWAPVGQLSWANLHGMGLAIERKGKIYLTSLGLARLNENPDFKPGDT